MPQSSERTMSHALAGEPPRTSLGLVTYCFENAKKARNEAARAPDYTNPRTFIQQAWSIGANAVQIPFGVLEKEAARELRNLASAKRIALESTVACPKSDADTARFEAELKTLADLGVRIARTVVFTARRYEVFRTAEEFEAARRSAREALRRAIPIAKRHGIRLALENHKDLRLEESLAILEEFSSESLGACLDVGNNIALLEDPAAVAEAFAPWTITVHFKDQGIRAYEHGFLLADVPLGHGCIDLKRIVAIVREKRPNARFHLELITRDPLEIPCLRPDYWPTLEELKAPQLAAQLETLRRLSSPRPFPSVSARTTAERVDLERRNVEQSFAYAAKHLGFKA